jgi:hypothetical protein
MSAREFAIDEVEEDVESPGDDDLGPPGILARDSEVRHLVPQPLDRLDPHDLFVGHRGGDRAQTLERLGDVHTPEVAGVVGPAVRTVDVVDHQGPVLPGKLGLEQSLDGGVQMDRRVPESALATGGEVIDSALEEVQTVGDHRPVDLGQCPSRARFPASPSGTSPSSAAMCGR